MWPEAPPSSDGYHPTAIELHLFVPARDGQYHSMLQEDDGLTLSALDGACYRTTFEIERSGGRLTIRAEVSGNGYPDFAREQFHLVLHGAEPATVLHDGTELRAEDGRYVIPNRGSGFDLDLSLPD